MTGLLILVAVALAAIAWWRLLQGKESARAAAAIVCRRYGLVLMDDTVMLHDIQLRRRDPVHAWGFRYTFDFAHNGILRHGGTVLIAPGQPPTVVVETDTGRLIERA